MNINFEYYKIFYIVAKNKNITKGAYELNISQPAISRIIKTLEEQIGFKLFIREKKGVILTREGKRLFDDIKNEIAKLISIDKNINEKRDIDFNISISPLLLTNWLANKFNLNHFNIDNFSFHEIYNLNELNTKIMNGSIDCAIVNENTFYKFDKDIEIIKIPNFHIGLYESENNKNKNSIIVPTSNHIYTQIINKLIQKNKLSYKNKIYTNDFNSILKLVQLGQGQAFLIQELIENNNLTEIKIDNKENEMGFLFIYKNELKENNRMKELISIITN